MKEDAITQKIAIIQNLDMDRQDIQSKIVITLFALLAELERDLISLRTKEALAAKKSTRKEPVGAQRDYTKK